MCTYIHSMVERRSALCMYVRMYVCMYVCMYVSILGWESVCVCAWVIEYFSGRHVETKGYCWQ